ncbi:30314_t:CDS:2, partial [Gigaspora margarita]
FEENSTYRKSTMKILTKEEEEEHYRATVKGGIKGAIIGLGVSLGVSLVAQRYSRFYQHLTLPIKAFLVSSGATAACITSAERAGLNYERRRYGFYQPVKEPHQQLPTTRVVKDFISENRYSIVCGSWALIQARMYAQALTIVMVLATAGLSMSSNQPKITVGSDQWKEIVAAEERKMNKIQEIKDHE